MANPIVKILRRMTGAAGAPSNLGEGALAFNKTEDKLYFGTGATPEVIAGKGEFVDKSSEQTVTGKKNFTSATVSTAPSDSNDVVRKTELDAEASARASADTALGQRIDALGSAFNYVGTIAGGTEASPTLLASLAQKDAGDYYKVTTAGHFKLGSDAAFFANVGDGLVFNNASGIDKIDNTDSTVAGTSNEITVTGSTDTGYTVAIATEFKSRVATLETTAAGLGTISTQNADNVAITGGAINGTTIGGTTAAAGSFTTLAASGTTTLSGNLVGTGSNQITDFTIDAGTF